MRLAVLFSLMSLKISQHLAVSPAKRAQSTTGMASTLMACVQLPVFVSNWETSPPHYDCEHVL